MQDESRATALQYPPPFSTTLCKDGDTQHLAPYKTTAGIGQLVLLLALGVRCQDPNKFLGKAEWFQSLERICLRTSLDF